MLSKEGELINDYTSTVPFIQKGASIFEMNGFNNEIHKWSIDSSAVLEQIDTLGINDSSILCARYLQRNFLGNKR